MLRVLVVVIVISFFPLIARAEEKTIEQHAEIQAEKEEQILVTVSIEKQSGEVRISIVNVKKENKEERQEGELVLPDNKETISSRKHSRRRGK